MPSNKRIFFAVHAVGIAPKDSQTYTAIHGLQSAGITTTFNLEQVFEIGQLSIYENIEDIADVELTLEKVIDGYPLIYHLATQSASIATLSGRSDTKCNAAMSIFGDTQDAASGTPVSEVEMSGLFVSSLNYTVPVEGNCTESVTLVGNHKVWRVSGYTFSGALFDDTDEPLSLTSGTGGVQRRENVIFNTNIAALDANGQVNATDATILPVDIPGISSSGTNETDSEGKRICHLQNITISTDLGRDPIFQLGEKIPYHRFVTFPIEVTCDIEVVSTSGDMISATEDGVKTGGNNLSNATIKVKLEESSFFNLGTKNKLSSVTHAGGDTGGANVAVTYSFSTFNDLSVSHDQSP